MPGNPYPPRPAAMASRLGHHLLLSLGIATATAVLATLPGLLAGTATGHGPAGMGSQSVMMPKLALLRDGKITDRLDRAAIAEGMDFAANPQTTPAALAMPMSVAWPERSEWAPPQYAALARSRLEGTERTRQASAQRRTAPPSERYAAMAGPLVILPPAAASALETVQAIEEAGDDSWSRYVVAPATKVVDAVSGAAGSVQAAGSWGLSQTTSLLPRW